MKVWRPKPPNKYLPMDFGADDVDEDLYLSPTYGRAVRKPAPGNDVPARTDILEWTGSAEQQAFIHKNLNVPPDFDPQAPLQAFRYHSETLGCFCP